jgi:NAD(P)-dependent dehydrogenase (short-subunit alcohol dehydrogenase family)
MTVVLITGCSSGFGLETALAFARRGDTTYATMRNLKKSDVLRARAMAENLALEVLALDIDDESSVREVVGQIEAAHGAVDVLVNNAGIGSLGSVETVELTDAQQVFETNLWGAVRMMQAVLPAMRTRHAGVIINVTSIAARLPGVGHTSWYGASKHALSVVSEGLAQEMQGRGVRIVSVEPGFFKTAINNGVVDQDDSDPYAADRRWMQAYYDSGVASGDDPSIVADAIVSAAFDPATPLHVIVGKNMQSVIEFSQASSFEDWLGVHAASVEGVSGPRPQP